MNDFKVESTVKTPEICGYNDRGEISIKGKCIPEDAREFFSPFRNWLLEFTDKAQDPINVEVDLEYFNTSTSNILLDIFKHLSRVNEKKSVKIKWIYEEDDLDMQEVGEDYKLMVGEIMTLESKEVL